MYVINFEKYLWIKAYRITIINIQQSWLKDNILKNHRDSQH